MQQLIENAKQHTEQTAIVAGNVAYSYAHLLQASESIAGQLMANEPDLHEARVAFMVTPGFDYVKTQWAIWQAGGIAVPLSLSNPLPAQQYVMQDTGCSILIADKAFGALLEPIIQDPSVRFIATDDLEEDNPAHGSLPAIAGSRRAMIIYTSGTTGQPKGVVTTHANIEAQVSTLVEAWGWTKEDSILNVLPLHHIHGVINVITCALWSGASCVFIPKFDAGQVLGLLSSGQINLFMAVPTVYYKLIAHCASLSAARQEELLKALSQFRLMVSGSAALPVSVMEQWEAISGHQLLERYGMTETGMAISNPYRGERSPGHIGQPLPGVEVRIVDENDHVLPSGASGEIQVKGPGVFREYWGKPETTAAAFTADGWFRTGDVAMLNKGSYKILGRMSVDIIKSGGYKISALEIEEVLRTHPRISDCAVVGIPDPEWDEIIAAGLVLTDKAPIEPEALKAWLRERLAAYKIPRRYLVLADLPRNAMGKVTKQALKRSFSEAASNTQ